MKMKCLMFYKSLIKFKAREPSPPRKNQQMYRRRTEIDVKTGCAVYKERLTTDFMRIPIMELASLHWLLKTCLDRIPGLVTKQMQKGT